MMTRILVTRGKSARAWCAVAALGLLLAATSTSHAQAPNLGTTGEFGVLAGSAISNTGPTVITGNVGLSPGSAVTGFPPGLVLAPGATHVANAVAVQAQVDLTNAYNSLAGRPTTVDLSGQNLGGLTLTPGVYNFASSAQLTGRLTLNALGNPNAVFIFNVGTTLTTASGAVVNVIGGGTGSNVFWRVGSSATLGTTTTFLGDILALTSITLNTGATISCGGALARNGAVTLDTNTISNRNAAGCAAALLPPVGPGVPPIGGTIDTIFTDTGGAIPQAFLDLSALSPEALAAALRQLSGEAGTGLAQVGFQSMNSFLSLVLNPFAGSQPDRGPPVVRALGFAPESSLPPELVSAYASIVNKAPPGVAIDRSRQRWGVWAAAYGGESKTAGDASLGTHDRTGRAYGFATGFDYRVTPDTVVGFALAGGGTNYGISDSLGGGRSDMAQAAVYSSTRFNAAYVSTALAYAWHRVSTDRWLTIAGQDHLTSDFSAHSVGGRVEAGYRFAMPGVLGMPGYGITPYAAVQGQVFRTPFYSERAVSGSGVFALDYDARTATTIRTELGAWFDQTVLYKNGSVLTLRARAAWAHDETSDTTLRAAFQTLPGSSFTIDGAKPVSDSALLSAAAWLKFTNNVSVGARFDSEFAPRSQTYAGTGVVRYTW